MAFDKRFKSSDIYWSADVQGENLPVNEKPWKKLLSKAHSDTIRWIQVHVTGKQVGISLKDNPR